MRRRLPLRFRIELAEEGGEETPAITAVNIRIRHTDTALEMAKTPLFVTAAAGLLDGDGAACIAAAGGRGRRILHLGQAQRSDGAACVVGAATIATTRSEPMDGWPLDKMRRHRSSRRDQRAVRTQ